MARRHVRPSSNTTEQLLWASLTLSWTHRSDEEELLPTLSWTVKLIFSQWKSSHRECPKDKLTAKDLLTTCRITFSYGGIAIDKNGHALSPDKTPIPGLLVAGTDAGGFSNLGYAGGLALAFVTGFWAARTIAKELNFREPSLPSIAAEDRDLIATARL